MAAQPKTKLLYVTPERLAKNSELTAALEKLASRYVRITNLKKTKYVLINLRALLFWLFFVGVDSTVRFFISTYLRWESICMQ